ncbi:MAG: DUF309 domain-containing protein [Candidatus Promineifilaceae bacterium]
MSKENPLIIGYLANLAIASEIENAAGKLGFTVAWVASAETLGTAEVRDRPGEPILGGQTASLTAQLSDKQPDLLIFDLDNAAIPATRWIAIIKSSPATRRIPVLAYGAEGDLKSAEAAQQAGADAVVTPHQFRSQLPDLINKHAKRIDYVAILNACEQPLSDLARQGIELFNRGDYYEAHHGLEDAWRADTGPTRDLYRGILQVAVAYLQIERGNYRGAVKMFLRVRQWLDPLPDRCRDVNIAQLRADSQAAQAKLKALGPERIKEFDKTYLKPVLLH